MQHLARTLHLIVPEDDRARRLAENAIKVHRRPPSRPYVLTHTPLQQVKLSAQAVPQALQLFELLALLMRSTLQ